MRFFSILFLTTLLLVGTILVDAKKHTSTAVRRREQHNSVEKRHTYHGKATWFIPSLHGGSMGACWEYEADNDYVVAMVCI